MEIFLVAKITPCFENGKGALCKGLKNGIGYGTTELHVIRPNKNFSPEFLYYWTQSEQFHQIGESMMTGSAGQKRIPLEFVTNFKILYPTSLQEQSDIANFLKIRISQIEQIIEKKNRLIQLLKEKHQSTINQTVTKGLDLSLPMKDCRIEWIGDIPKHWKINKIKYCSYVKGRIGWQRLKADEFVDNGPYLITGTDFEKGTISWNKCYHVSDWRYELNPYIHVKKHDILITKDGHYR